MYMYICIYIFLQESAHQNIFVCLRTNILDVKQCMYVCMYHWIYVCVYISTYIYIYVYIHIHIDIYIYMYIHISTRQRAPKYFCMPSYKHTWCQAMCVGVYILLKKKYIYMYIILHRYIYIHITNHAPRYSCIPSQKHIVHQRIWNESCLNESCL